MEKHRHRQRESRHARSKQFDQNDNDHHSRPRSRGVLVTSGTRESNGNSMRDEAVPHLRVAKPGVPPRDDYVRRWLSRTTHQDPLPSNAELGSRKGNVSHSINPGGFSRGLGFDQFLQDKDRAPSGEHTGEWDKPRKRILESSSDCPFLERALASDPLSEDVDRDNMVERIEVQKESKTRRQRRKLESSISLEGSVVSLSIKPQVESFKKRKRHKTHEDRYEPKKALVDHKPQIDRQRKAETREKIKTRRRAPKSNGEDLMHKFSSKSVGLERLTMRPSHTVGLFKKGRASSPGRRRGLPDLAFSEMGFLRSSKQRPVEIEEGKSLSKSREKEKRRSERAQNEISEYFRPSKTQRERAGEAGRQHASNNSIAHHQLPPEEFRKERHQSSLSKSTSRSTDLWKEPVLELDPQYAFEQPTATSHSRGHIIQPRRASNTTMDYSDRVTSYYTWSDSVRPPEVLQNRRRMRSEASKTPDSVRQMLNDTGIFKDTGIDRNVGRRCEIARREPVRSRVHSQPLRLSKGSNDMSPITHTCKSSLTGIQSLRPLENVEENIDKNHHSHKAVKIRHLDESFRSMEGGEVIRPLKTIMHHCSPDSGWQQHLPDDEAATHSYPSKAKFSQQGTPRQIIAQRAYVKQASTTRAAEIGIDNTDNIIMSAEEPKIGATVPYRQHDELLTYGEGYGKTIDHSTPWSGSEEKLERVACSVENVGTDPLTDPHINRGRPTQAPNALVSDSQSDRHPDALPITGRAEIPSRTLEPVSDFAMTHQLVNGSSVQTSGIEFGGCTHSVAHNSIFEGLPLRGSRPNRASWPISTSRTVFNPMEIEPLYRHQLENRISHEPEDQNYTDSKQMDQLLHRFDPPFIEYSHDEEGELYGSFEGEYELLNSTGNLQECDTTFSNESGNGVYMAQQEEEEEEEEDILWNIRDEDLTLQAARQQQSYDRTQYAGSLNQPRLQDVGPNPDREGRHYHSFPDRVPEFAREEAGGDYHELNRFWQPRRQY